MRDKARGKLKPILNTGNVKNIYAVHIEDGGKLSKYALDYDGTVTVIKRSSNMREAIFIVHDSNSKRKNRVPYSFDLNEQPRYDLKSLEYSKINQMISDRLRDIDLQRDNNNNPICCLHEKSFAESSFTSSLPAIRLQDVFQFRPLSVAVPTK